MKTAYLIASLLILTQAPKAHADWVVPQDQMTDQAIGQIVSVLDSTVLLGTYNGTTSTGDPCSISVTQFAGGMEFYPDLTFQVGSFYRLLNFSKVTSSNGGETQINLAVDIIGGETPSYVKVMDISEKNGIPTSIQFGGAGPLHGGGGIPPGDIYTPSEITEFPVCANLVKSQ